MTKSNNEDQDRTEESQATGPEAGSSGATEPTAARDPMQKLAEERDQLQSQLQRTLADLQNFRKRRAQEMADIRKTTVEAMTTELLPVLDNFHLATTLGDNAGDEAVQSMRDGVEMIRGMLEGVFIRHGVQEIPAEGQRFDPNIHEAVGIDPDPEAEEGLVTKIIQKGYEIDGRVIRPSRVMVGGAPPVAAQDS